MSAPNPSTTLRWKYQLLTYLTAQDLNHYITSKIKSLTDADELNIFCWSRAKFMEAIKEAIDINNYNSISTTDPKEAFDSPVKDHGIQSGLLTAGVISQISSLKLLLGALRDKFLVEFQSLHKGLDSYVSEDHKIRISVKIYPFLSTTFFRLSLIRWLNWKCLR